MFICVAVKLISSASKSVMKLLQILNAFHFKHQSVLFVNLKLKNSETKEILTSF